MQSAVAVATTDDQRVSTDTSRSEAEARAGNFRTAFDGRKMNEYRGLSIFAAPGLHQAAAALFASAVAAGARVLEVGAGSGAMSLRLSDAGFAVTASDLFQESFKPVDVPFVAADLNTEFAPQLTGRFDAVMALEIVEHLENPRHLLRQLRAILPPGGQLILSTPNIANPVSQALFLRRGQFQWFRDEDYREQGHITPLSPWQIEKVLAECGFALREERAVSNPYRRAHKLGFGVHMLSRLFGLLSGLPRSRRGEVWLIRAEAVRAAP